jgi:hypothetical protein
MFNYLWDDDFISAVTLELEVALALTEGGT